MHSFRRSQNPKIQEDAAGPGSRKALVPSAALYQTLRMGLRAARSSYRTEIHPTAHPALADRLPSPTQSTRLQEDPKNNNKIPIPLISFPVQTARDHSCLTPNPTDPQQHHQAPPTPPGRAPVFRAINHSRTPQKHHVDPHPQQGSAALLPFSGQLQEGFAGTAMFPCRMRRGDGEVSPQCSTLGWKNPRQSWTREGGMPR